MARNVYPFDTVSRPYRYTETVTFTQIVTVTGQNKTLKKNFTETASRRLLQGNRVNRIIATMPHDILDALGMNRFKKRIERVEFKLHGNGERLVFVYDTGNTAEEVEAALREHGIDPEHDRHLKIYRYSTVYELEEGGVAPPRGKPTVTIHHLKS